MANFPGVEAPEISFDFSFGFNNVQFSDRILLLDIIDHKLLHSFTEEIPPPARVIKTIHINSLILAGRSPFFLKMFSNGMRESEKEHGTIQIEASEEVSFMDLLKYIYSNDLPSSLFALLNLLKIADKFDVPSCLKDCIRSLQKLPMTLESASLYLDLPPGLLMSPALKPFINAAKEYDIARFKAVNNFKEEMLNLPLAHVKEVLSGNKLRVASECDVYDLVITWARKHYPDLEERREILKTHLLPLVRFPFMTTTKLKEEVLTCSDIDPELASSIVFRALRFKLETPHGRRCILAAEDDGNAMSRQFVERTYEYGFIKVVVFELPHKKCTVFLHLRWEELRDIFPDGEIRSEVFHLDGKQLVLTGKCFLEKKTNLHYFILCLKVVGAAVCTVKYDIALRKKPSEEFVSWVRGSHAFIEPGSIKHLRRVQWTSFVVDDSPYFINGSLHLKANIAIKQ